MSLDQQNEQSEVSVGTQSAAKITVNNLSKVYDTKDGEECVFDDISFEAEAGSFVTLIGKSGSGKSTMMDIISGVTEPTTGEVTFTMSDSEGEVDVGHIFQSPRLLPWNTCIENIELVHENNPEYTETLAEQALDLVGLNDHYNKYPSQLSGGQKQRVGIARGLSIDPEILLMDEPFSNLDEITATELRKEIVDIWTSLNKTVFFITHDIDEAIQLSDRILMLGDNRIYADMTVDIDRPRVVDSEEFLLFRQRAIDKFHSIDQ
jgi:NitT/TauT family transport system ATP-binding protein